MSDEYVLKLPKIPLMKYMLDYRNIWKKYKYVNINIQWPILNIKTSQNAIYIICVIIKILKKCKFSELIEMYL